VPAQLILFHSFKAAATRRGEISPVTIVCRPRDRKACILDLPS
jgi:hypothetical protein